MCEREDCGKEVKVCERERERFTATTSYATAGPSPAVAFGFQGVQLPLWQEVGDRRVLEEAVFWVTNWTWHLTIVYGVGCGI